ncbi:RteC domain-containing protein [Bacteroides fragilis]
MRVSVCMYYADISRKRNRRRAILKFVFCIVIRYIDTELEILNRYGDTYPSKSLASKRRWTGTVVELVELIYDLHEMKRIDDREIPLNELAGFFGEIFGIRLDARSFYDAYTDIKRRKGESRYLFSRQVARASEPTDATRR